MVTMAEHHTPSSHAQGRCCSGTEDSTSSASKSKKVQSLAQEPKHSHGDLGCAPHQHFHEHHHHDRVAPEHRVNRTLFLSDSEADDCDPETVCTNENCVTLAGARGLPSLEECMGHAYEDAGILKCRDFHANTLIRRHMEACTARHSDALNKENVDDVGEGGSDSVSSSSAANTGRVPPRAPRRKPTARRRPSKSGKPSLRTAYQVFAKEEHARLAKANVAFSSRSALISRQWASMDLGERSQYEKWAEAERAEQMEAQTEQEMRYLTSGFGSWGWDSDTIDKVEAVARDLAKEGY